MPTGELVLSQRGDEYAIRLKGAELMNSRAHASEELLATLAHASHNEFRERLYEVQRTQGTKAYLEMRDGPFQPEPLGPKSAKARAARAAEKKTP